MAAKKTGKTPATVTLKHLAAKIAEDHEIAKKQSEAILGDTVALVVKHLKGGQRIRLAGLGILVFGLLVLRVRRRDPRRDLMGPPSSMPQRPRRPDLPR